MNVFIAIDIVLLLLLCAFVIFGIVITSGVFWLSFLILTA